MTHNVSGHYAWILALLFTINIGGKFLILEICPIVINLKPVIFSLCPLKNITLGLALYFFLNSLEAASLNFSGTLAFSFFGSLL